MNLIIAATFDPLSGSLGSIGLWNSEITADDIDLDDEYGIGLRLFSTKEDDYEMILGLCNSLESKYLWLHNNCTELEIGEYL